jgi:hypothetical protein
LLKYVPGVPETVTLKCNVKVPGEPDAGGTTNGPGPQLRLWPTIVGSAVVAPLLEPRTYVKPVGSWSLIVVRVAGWLPGFEIVIV